MKRTRFQSSGINFVTETRTVNTAVSSSTPSTVNAETANASRVELSAASDHSESALGSYKSEECQIQSTASLDPEQRNLCPGTFDAVEIAEISDNNCGQGDETGVSESVHVFKHLYLQVSCPVLKQVLEPLGMIDFPSETAPRMRIAEAAGAVNQAFSDLGDHVARLSEDNFEAFAKAVNCCMMLLTGSIFSKLQKQSRGLKFACIRRHKATVDLQERKRLKHSATVPGLTCNANYTVTFAKKGVEEKFQLIVLSPESTEHAREPIVCERFPRCEIERNQNYIKGVVTNELKEAVVTKLMRLRQHDPSLRNRNVELQIDACLAEFKIAKISPSAKRDLAKNIELELYGKGDITEYYKLHSIESFIEKLKSRKLDYEVYVKDGIVEAIYWTNPVLVEGLDQDSVNVIVHDTSFGIVNALCGYEKFSVLASVEKCGDSHQLVNGLSISDKHEYFEVMLKLFKRTYPTIAKHPRLGVMSDEDKAFLKAVDNELPHANKSICLWHKKRNFAKSRKSSAASSGKAGEKVEN